MSDVRAAEVLVPTTDFPADLTFFTETLGFRLDTIFPADDPAVATLSGHGLSIRLDRTSGGSPVTLRLLCEDPAEFAGGRLELVSPGGTRVLVVPFEAPLVRPPTAHAFVVRRLKDNAPWVIGRAGMAYRDLIPGRLGGSIIASHIRIKDAGPVPDMVHYHTVGFQLIYCYRGWVRLVYEDQGPAFVLGAGDCVIQPPKIRHRVLEASEGVEVVEIGVPAEHVTTVDHDMELPNGVINPDRDFSGQRFCRSLVADAVWTPGRLPGFEVRETGIGAATGGVASVQVARPAGPAVRSGRSGPSGDVVLTSHAADIFFTFVLSGSVTLNGRDQGAHVLGEGDAYVIPPGLETSLTDPSADLELLEVSLPATFETR